MWLLCDPRQHREYKPFETLPGEQAQADWGHFGTITMDGATYKLYAFVFTLCWSRVSYVEFVVRTDMATFLSCLYRALEYIGGVHEEIVFDNARVVVSGAGGQDSQVQRKPVTLCFSTVIYDIRPAIL
ncbi:MAG: DDE-type integrase/transposase/recombinase [Thermoanaerobacterales bacterium]|nr:DDE-type integrase/transposase/recombinase [Thermoanaerobacterales bacterium]